VDQWLADGKLSALRDHCVFDAAVPWEHTYTHQQGTRSTCIHPLCDLDVCVCVIMCSWQLK
jgi:hypothetical protein